MNDWQSIDARRKATYAFCKHLQEHTDEMPKSSDEAKRLFAKLGGFYVEGDQKKAGEEALPAIPAKTEFKVYPFEPISKRDEDVVCIVLPADPVPADESEFEATTAWGCTWSPYFD